MLSGWTRMFTAITIAATVTGPAAAQGLPEPEAYTPTYLADRAQIIDVIGSVGFYADQRRWDRVAAAFANPAVIDFRSSQTTAAGGTEPSRLTPQEIVTAWQSQLPGYQHTQHLITNPIVRIEGERAFVTSQVNATHYLPNDAGEHYWIFVGFYEHELTRTAAGWKITLMRAYKLFDLGNPELPSLASARVGRGEIATAP
jgi:hypothetical protein